jgi:hypothetical protein
MIMGGLAGFAVWTATGAFVYLPVFLGNGVVLGMVLDQAIRKPR